MKHDHDGEISRRHGSTLMATLREIHGGSFAIGFDGGEKLAYVLERLDQESLAHLMPNRP
jgi:hypothetical protein